MLCGPTKDGLPISLHSRNTESAMYDRRVVAASPAVPEVEVALVPIQHQSPDHVALYKVFPECKAVDVKDRIHYFSFLLLHVG